LIQPSTDSRAELSVGIYASVAEAEEAALDYLNSVSSLFRRAPEIGIGDSGNCWLSEREWGSGIVFLRKNTLVSLSIYGRTDRREQIRQIAKGVDQSLATGTPAVELGSGPVLGIQLSVGKLEYLLQEPVTCRAALRNLRDRDMSLPDGRLLLKVLHPRSEDWLTVPLPMAPDTELGPRWSPMYSLPKSLAGGETVSLTRVISSIGDPGTYVMKAVFSARDRPSVESVAVAIDLAASVEQDPIVQVVRREDLPDLSRLIERVHYFGGGGCTAKEGEWFDSVARRTAEAEFPSAFRETLFAAYVLRHTRPALALGQETQSAMQLADLVHRDYPDSVLRSELLVRQFLVAYRRGQYSEAVGFWEKGRSLDLSNRLYGEPWLALCAAQSYYKDNRLEEAERWARGVVACRPPGTPLAIEADALLENIRAARPIHPEASS
jgi:hypothetical protein